MLKLLEVSRIVQGKNIRDERDNEILELADSIEKNGLINPITVQEIAVGKYEVVAGHRRFEAIKRLGYPHVECNIVEDMNSKDIILAQIAENVQRKQMSAYELVKTFEELKRKYNMNQKAIAVSFGKTQSWVSEQYQAVKLLEQQYDGNVPEEKKKQTVSQIIYNAKKTMAEKELIICDGLKVTVTGHKYAILCQTNEAENELRALIEKRRIGR